MRLAQACLLTGVTAFVLLFGAEMWPSSLWSVFALFTFFWFVLVSLLREPTAFGGMIVFIPVMFSMFFSLCVIDNGVFLFEVADAGKQSSAAPALLLFYAFFAFIFSSTSQAVGFEVDANKWRGRVYRKRWLFVGPSFLFFLTLFAFGFYFGFPLITGVDRYYYRFSIAGDIFTSLMQNAPIIAILLGAYGASGGANSRKSSILLLLCNLVMLVLFSEKFFTHLRMLGYFSLPFFLTGVVDKKDFTLLRVSKVLVCIALLVFFLMFLVYYIYSSSYGILVGQSYALMKFTSRIGAQAQLWFMAWGNFNFWEFNEVQIRNIIKGTLMVGADFGRSPPYGGTYLMMSIFAPPEVFWTAMNETNVTYIMGAEAYFYYVGGGVGLLILGGLNAAGYGLVIALLGKSIKSGKWLAILMSSKIIIWAQGSVEHGYIWQIFGVKTLLVALFIIIIINIGSGERRGVNLFTR